VNITHTDDHEHGRVYHATDAHKPTMRVEPRGLTSGYTGGAIALSDCRVIVDGVVTRVIGRRKPSARKTADPIIPDAPRQRIISESEISYSERMARFGVIGDPD
jgi:hypothetical protein